MRRTRATDFLASSGPELDWGQGHGTDHSSVFAGFFAAGFFDGRLLGCRLLRRRLLGGESSSPMSSTRSTLFAPDVPAVFLGCRLRGGTLLRARLRAGGSRGAFLRRRRPAFGRRRVLRACAKAATLSPSGSSRRRRLRGRQPRPGRALADGQFDRASAPRADARRPQPRGAS